MEHWHRWKAVVLGHTWSSRDVSFTWFSAIFCVCETISLDLNCLRRWRTPEGIVHLPRHETQVQRTGLLFVDGLSFRGEAIGWYQHKWNSLGPLRIELARNLIEAEFFFFTSMFSYVFSKLCGELGRDPHIDLHDRINPVFLELLFFRRWWSTTSQALWFYNAVPTL